jgi:iron complex outermembrane receptor protein
MSGVAAYFYDVQRLEVLRGPQGTLYGRNSTTGVVNLITNKPNFDGYSGNFEVGAGNFSATNAQGAFNLPFSDNVAARVAFTYQKHDGYLDNGPLVEDLNDADDLGVRAHLLWNVGDATSLLFTADYYEKDAIGNNTVYVPCFPDVPCNLGLGLTNDEGDTPLVPQAFRPPGEQESFRDNSDTNFKFELNHSFENFDLTALLSSREHERDYNTGSSTSETANGVVLDGGVREVTKSESTSAELRLTSTGDGRLQWIAGLYALDEEINGNFQFQPNILGSPNIGNHFNINFIDRDLSIESQAVFGNLSYDLSDTVTFRVGLRYTDDEKDKGGIASDPSAGSYFRVWVTETGQTFGPPFRAQVANPSWSETTYDVGLDMAVSDDAMVYAKYSTGYKAGGFNRGSAGPGSDPMNGVFMLDIYDPETVDAFEVGYKGSFMGGRGRINIAAFLNDYGSKVESVVRILNGVPTNTAVNATNVDIVGLEIESSILYGDSGGRIDVALGLLDATYGEFDSLPDPILGGGATLDVSGQTVLNAPERSASVSWVPAEWNVMNGVLTPRVQIAYKSDYTTRPHGLLVDIQDDYTRSNLSLYWESDDNGWFGEVFIRNIEDEIVQSASGCGSTGNFVPTGTFVSCTKMFQAPRTGGVRFGYRFD